MRIGISTRILLSTTTGMRRYTLELINQLKKIIKPSDELIFFWGPGYEETDYLIEKDEINKIKISKKIKKQKLWEQFILPYRMKKNNLDIYHCTTNYNIPFLNLTKIPIILTIHDIIPVIYPRYYSKYENIRFSFASKSADYIIADSENTKNDLINKLKVNSEKISVIPLDISKKFFKKNIKVSKLDEVKNKYRINSPYLLATGGPLEAKNNYFLFDVMKYGIEKYSNIFENLELVVTSPRWLESRIPESTPDNINFVGYIEEEDFPVLLSGAEIFLFPSLYEGFGLPPLEAMAAQTAVIGSNKSSIPEVVGDAGLLLDPSDCEKWVNAIKKVLSGNQREYYIEKSLKRLDEFSWKKSAEKLYEIYEKINFKFNKK